MKRMVLCRLARIPRSTIALLVVLLASTVAPASTLATLSAEALAPSKPPAVIVDDDNAVPGKRITAWPTSIYSVSPSDTVDYYNITLERSRDYYFRLAKTGGTGSAELTLYEPLETGETILTTITPTSSSGGRIAIRPESTGKHYLRVRSTGGTCNYRLYGPEVVSSVPGFTLGDLLWGVNEKTGELSGYGQRCVVYSLSLQEGLTYHFNAARKSGEGTLVFKLFGPDCASPYDETALVTGIGGSTHKSLKFTPTSTDTYYLALMWSGAAGEFRLVQPASPFALDNDAYSFENFGGYASQALFRSVFGILRLTLTTQESTYYEDVFKTKYGGGVCYGFATTAGMFYRRSRTFTAYGPAPAAFSPGATSVRQLTRATTGGGSRDIDEPIEQHISKYYYYQYDPWVRATWYSFNGSDVENVSDMINDELERGWVDPYFLGGWGHAVNITGIRPTVSAGNARFVIYDNNHANDFQLMEAVGGVVRYHGSEISTPVVRHILPHATNSIDPLWGSYAGVVISVVPIPTTLPSALVATLPTSAAPSVRLLHTDAEGRRLGTTADGRQVSEIPGGELIVPETGLVNSSWKPPLEYYLPKGRDYTVEASRVTTGTLKYRLFLAGDLVEFDASGVGAKVAPRIQTSLSQHGFGFSYRMEEDPEGPEPEQGKMGTARAQQRALGWSQSQATTPTVTLRLDREVTKGVNRKFELSGLKIGSSQVITPTAPGAGTELRLTSNALLPSFSLRLTSFQGRRRVTTPLSTVPAASGKQQSIVVWNWATLATTPVFRVEQTAAGESITALRIPALSASAFAAEMGVRRLLGTPTLSLQIQSKARLLSTASFKTYLKGLVASKSLSQRNAGLLFAYFAAAKSVPIATATPGSVLQVRTVLPTLVR